MNIRLNAIGAALVAFAAASVWAKSTVWQGGTGEAVWNNAANWTDGIPDADGDEATVNVPDGSELVFASMGTGAQVNVTKTGTGMIKIGSADLGLGTLTIQDKNVTFTGGTLNANLLTLANGPSVEKSGNYVAVNAQVVFKGYWMHNFQTAFLSANGSDIRFEGGILHTDRGSSKAEQIYPVSKGGTFTLAGAASTLTGIGGINEWMWLRVAVAGNLFVSTGFAKSFIALYKGSWIDCDVPYAFNLSNGFGTINMFNGVIRLNGNDQRLAGFNQDLSGDNAGEITSETDAVCYMNCHECPDGRTWSGKVTGKAGLSKYGRRTLILGGTGFTTSGRLEVTGGLLKLAAGSRWINGTDVRIGASGTLELSDALNLNAGTLLQVTPGGKLSIPDGVTVALGGVYINNSGTLSPLGFNTTYQGSDGTDPDAERVTWIAGAGKVSVSYPPLDPVSAVWTGGAGANTAIDAAANWEGGVTPSLADGSAAVTFTGTGSKATVNRSVAFRSMTFNTDNALFGVEGTGPLNLLSGGIAVTAPAEGTPDYTVSAPLTLYGGNQQWSISSGTLRLSSVQSDGTADVVYGGAGRLELGPCDLGGGTLSQDSETATGKLILQGGEYNMNLSTVLHGTTDAAAPLEVPANAVCVLKGSYTHYAQTRLLIADNAKLIVCGGIFDAIPGTVWASRKEQIYPVCVGTGELVISNTPCVFTGIGAWKVRAIVRLCVSGNSFYSNSTAKQPTIYLHSGTTIYCEAPYALNCANGYGYVTGSGTTLNGGFDLGGYDQLLAGFGGDFSGGFITSAEPCVCYMNIASSVLSPRTWTGNITGKAGFSKRGGTDFTLAGSGYTTEGRLEVTEGTLCLAASARWVNGLDVRVVGTNTVAGVTQGNLHICGNACLNRTATLRAVGDGTLTIDEGVVVSVREAYVGNTQLDPGLYSGDGRTGTTKMPVLSDGISPRILGGGILRVRGFGSQVIIH